MSPESTTGSPSAQILLCTHCGCEIDFCSFCDRTDCAAACCYGCLVIALGESKAPLHAHGG
jgi:hypothetical protein